MCPASLTSASEPNHRPLTSSTPAYPRVSSSATPRARLPVTPPGKSRWLAVAAAMMVMVVMQRHGRSGGRKLRRASSPDCRVPPARRGRSTTPPAAAPAQGRATPFNARWPIPPAAPSATRPAARQQLPAGCRRAPDRSPLAAPPLARSTMPPATLAASMLRSSLKITPSELQCRRADTSCSHAGENPAGRASTAG